MVMPHNDKEDLEFYVLGNILFRFIFWATSNDT